MARNDTEPGLSSFVIHLRRYGECPWVPLVPCKDMRKKKACDRDDYRGYRVSGNALCHTESRTRNMHYSGFSVLASPSQCPKPFSGIFRVPELDLRG